MEVAATDTDDDFDRNCSGAEEDEFEDDGAAGWYACAVVAAAAGGARKVGGRACACSGSDILATGTADAGIDDEDDEDIEDDAIDDDDDADIGVGRCWCGTFKRTSGTPASAACEEPDAEADSRAALVEQAEAEAVAAESPPLPR